MLYSYQRHFRICWPYRAEQPLNAMVLTDQLDIAYELVEIRTGDHANKPVCRSGKIPVGTVDAIRAEAEDIFARAFGADGERKRANVTKLQEATKMAWAEGGSSLRGINNFLDDIQA